MMLVLAMILVPTFLILNWRFSRVQVSWPSLFEPQHLLCRHSLGDGQQSAMKLRSAEKHEVIGVTVSPSILGWIKWLSHFWEEILTLNTQRPYQNLPNTVRGAELIALTPRGYGAHVSELADEEAPVFVWGTETMACNNHVLHNHVLPSQMAIRGRLNP